MMFGTKASRIICLALFVAGSLTVPLTAVQNDDRPSPVELKRMSPELLWKLGRLGGGVASSDGNRIAYTVRNYDLQENKGYTTLKLMDLKTGHETSILNNWPSIGELQWVKSGDKDLLFFVAKVKSESEETKTAPQAWSFEPVSGDTKQVTSVGDGIANLKVAPTGDKIAYTIDVKMDKDINQIFADLPKADARIIDGLMYRHWNAWHDYAYSHLHVATLGANGTAGEAVDLMDGVRADCPVPPFGGSEQFNWSPDGTEIAFTMKDVENWAESTNSDVYVVKADGKSKPVNVSRANVGNDNDPIFSPDGKYLAYHSMERPGFESDRNRIMMLDRETGSTIDLTRGLDQTAHGSVWMPDSKALLFVSEFRGTNQVFKVAIDSPSATQVSKGRYNWSVTDIMPDGKTALATRTDMIRPAELFTLNLTDATANVISHVNDEIYEDLELPTVEERWVEATDGQKIHCWVIHPPKFDASEKKKWPMLTYFQGGPQGQIGQWFSYRWNFHLMAAQGYVVLAPNRRGLPGFGRKWNDDISKDWGGQAMKDLLSATDDMLKEPYIDKDHVGGVGASFGGYTAYWMMGNHRDRFSTLIAHCGVFNLESMYGATEELFFVNWDLGGPYWKSQDILDSYRKFSPHSFIGKWNTPLLVIHGEKDFRVPVTQGMEAFTAAQVKGIPSRFLYFPEEGHWVMSPQNGVVWHRVFFEWLDRYCKPKKEDSAK